LLEELELSREASLTRHRLTQTEALAREDAASTMARAYALGDGELALVAAAKREARRARASAADALYDAWLFATVSQLYGASVADHDAPNTGS
jgi:hypothetical protein